MKIRVLARWSEAAPQRLRRLTAGASILLMVGALLSLFADENTDYTFAYRLYEVGDYETAKEEFDRFTANYPESDRADDALFLSAESARRLGKADEAVQKYRRLQNDYPGSPLLIDALQGLGRAWFEQNKYEESILALEEVVKRSEDDAVKSLALFYTAEAYYNVGNYANALEAYSALLSAFPDVEEAKSSQYGKGWSLFQLGRYQEAHDTLITFLGKYPNATEAPEATYRAAESLFLLENWSGAQAVYKQFVDTFGKDESHRPLAGDAELRIGQCLFRQQKIEEAKAQFERLVQLYPSLQAAEDAQYWIGEVLFQSERYNEAIYEYQRLLNAYPATELADDTYYSIGRAYFAVKEYRDAITALEAVVEFSDSQLRDAARWYLGESRRLLEEFNSALIWYRRVTAGSAYEDDALFGQGASNFALGEYQAAIDAYAKLLALQNSPLRKDALYQLGINQFHMKQHDEAIKSFDQFLAERGTNSALAANDDALYWKLRSQYDAKQYPATAETSRQLLAEFATSKHVSSARFFLAESLYWQGDYANARNEYESLLKDDPRGEWSENARYNVGWTYFSQAQTQSEGQGQQADYRRAIATWNELAAKPNVSESLGSRGMYDIGIAQLNLKQHENAIASFTAVVTKYPNSDWADDARFRIGWTKYRMDDFRGTLMAFDDFMTRHPNSALIPEAIFFKGNGFFKQKQYVEAIKQYDRVAKEYPTAVMTTAGRAGVTQIREEAQYQIGESYYNLAQYQNAIAVYELLQQLYPKSALADDAQFAVASAYQLLNNPDRALDAYRKLVADYPESDLAPETLLTIGVQHFDRKEFQQAIAEFQQVITRYRDSVSAPRAQYDIGRSYYQLKSYPEAVAAFQKVVEFQQATAQVKASGLYYAAFTLWDKQNPRRNLDRAAGLLRTLIADYPNTAETGRAYLLLAETFTEQNKMDDAAQAYRDLIAAAPNSDQAKTARIDLSQALYRMNRFSQALEAVAPITDEPSKFDPEIVVNAQLAAGDALVGLKKYDDAAKAYLVIALVYENHAPFQSLQALSRAGDAYEKAGRKPQAQRWYQKAVDDYQSHRQKTTEWNQYLGFARTRLDALSKPEGGQ